MEPGLCLHFWDAGDGFSLVKDLLGDDCAVVVLATPGDILSDRFRDATCDGVDSGMIEGAGVDGRLMGTTNLSM